MTTSIRPSPCRTGCTGRASIAAINDVYAYLHAINAASVEHGYGRLEELMQKAGFSGLLSQSFMRAVAGAFSSESPGLTLNQYPNGRPDLVPRAHYDGDAVKNGDEGVELKTSRSTSGWQGHNPEGGWLMVFQIAVDAKTEPIYERDPTRACRVLIAKLRESDWNFSGRGAAAAEPPRRRSIKQGERSLSGAPFTSGLATERRELRDRRPGDRDIRRVDLHADAAVADRLRRRQRRARPRERVQHDALPQRQRRPHDLTQERLRLEAGVLRDGRSSGRVGPESITSPNGRSAEMRRNPPTPHLRRLSWTRPSSGLRNVSHGSHIDRGMTLTPGNSSCAFFGRSPPRIVITRRTISPRRSNPASVTTAATR